MVTVNLDVLTPEQRAKVIKNDPSLASKYAISAPAKSTESTSSTGKYTLEQLSKDINSGAVKTQADVDKNVSTRGYSGNTVADKAPTGEPTKTFNDAVETALPGAESRSTLAEFADALDKATTLARQGRQAKELGILDSAGFQPGKVNASTMGQILNLLDQRSGNRAETLHTAAIDAYKMEEERKATEKTNIQNLALQMLTKGVDQTTIQGILNTTSLDQAMLAAAGALKATKDFQDIREIDGKLIGIKTDGSTEVIYEGVGGTGTDFTDAQKLKLEASGLLNAPRDQQLAALYPADETMTDEQKKVLYQQEFDNGIEYAASFDGSDEELEASLRRDAEYLQDGDITAIIDSRVSETEVSQKAVAVMADVWDKDLFQLRSGGEFTDAKAEAIKQIKAGDWEDIPSDSQLAKKIIDYINNMKYEDVKDSIK